MNITFEYDYLELLNNIYTDARWEVYYDLALRPFLSSCCSEVEEKVKVVPVYATRKVGTINNTKPHFIDKYSIKKDVIVNGEKKQRRFGIPDYVIVPKSSVYDCPEPSILNIEFKRPINLATNYEKCNPRRYKAEIMHQLEYCQTVIFTDGITWFFIDNKNVENNQMTSIELMDDNKYEICETKWNELRKKIKEKIVKNLKPSKS